ncbi:MAG: hypothetical protein J0L92_13040 [Deltaproteobacteria bacterium]|nr:hypothetical protein [Deltaproteobacteria bacterium]
MRIFASLSLAMSVLAITPDIAFACEPSASGAWSYDVSVSPRAGMLCLFIVHLHHDGTCSAPAEASFEVSCGETHRAAISDDGAYVSVLAPRASHRGWPIVRVFERDGAGVVSRTLTLEQLDPDTTVGSRPRLRVDAAGVVLDGGTASRTVSLVDLVTLARGRPAERRPF